ncbi:Tetratricopeptide repeat protein 39B [Cricetulus griseus]|uniref:Tetratricopeptide repeat protein 39B n=1 Tax=Cricetulus griseus TaxID=10029 RepID=G3HCA7_CRIGR|nr:Tetratricopeptide repeat protein 39B [Cricetulus griseus]ERE84580.1 tetratricopeptide repeat protein 39B [Cricetulus griseus]
MWVTGHTLFTLAVHLCVQYPCVPFLLPPCFIDSEHWLYRRQGKLLCPGSGSGKGEFQLVTVVPFPYSLEQGANKAKESMYHALGYSTIVVLQAIMTFEQQDIQNGISAMKDALQTCQKYRKKCTVVESFSSLLSRGSLEQLSEEEMHAEICYAECLLQKAALTFVQGSLILFYHARIELLKGNVEKATYVFLKAAILSMLPEEDVATTNENVVALFRQVDGLKQRIAGKSLPTEKFAVRKARRYSPSSGAPGKLVLPALEMMYVWNGFSIVAQRKDLSESLLVTVEKAEAALQNQNFADSVDDECLVKLLKGCCLKNLQRPLQAELCFNHILESEKLLKYDHYLVPFTLFELAFLYKSQGEIDKAIKALETARNNYKDYSLESRLHFRIQAALHLWKKPSSD